MIFGRYIEAPSAAMPAAAAAAPAGPQPVAAVPPARAHTAK
jgi:hypothetical protein